MIRATFGTVWGPLALGGVAVALLLWVLVQPTPPRWLRKRRSTDK